MRAQLGFLCEVTPTLRTPSHLMRAQLGFLCEVTPALRTSEPFDELSSQIFVRSDPRTANTPRNPDVGAKDSSDSTHQRAISALSHRALSSIRAANTITLRPTGEVRLSCLPIDLIKAETSQTCRCQTTCRNQISEFKHGGHISQMMRIPRNTARTNLQTAWCQTQLPLVVSPQGARKQKSTRRSPESATSADASARTT